jgi:succinyl-CoA synthetase alpha subunit
LGHAGAIISGDKGTAAKKFVILGKCVISVAKSPAEMAKPL